MPTSQAGTARVERIQRQRGFTLMLALVATVVVAMGAITAQEASSHRLQADREAELLFRGEAYRRAIRSFHEAGRPTATYPRSIDDLLADPRFPGRRHLRQRYSDPMFPEGDVSWRLIRAPDGGIAGVASTSTAVPRKQALFAPHQQAFEGAASYADWWFEHRPKDAVPGPVNTPGAGAYPRPVSGLARD